MKNISLQILSNLLEMYFSPRKNNFNLKSKLCLIDYKKVKSFIWEGGSICPGINLLLYLIKLIQFS